MEVAVEVKTSLKFINNGSSQMFIEGDFVLCCIKTDKRYMGKIVSINEYQLEQEKVIIIEMFDKSTEIVKVNDIMHLCKMPVNDFMNFPLIDERKDMDSFVNMLVATGTKKEGAERVYEAMRKIADLYNIPFSTILSEVICKTGVDNIRTQKDGLKIINQCMAIAIESFQNTTNILKKRVEKEFNAMNVE